MRRYVGARTVGRAADAPIDGDDERDREQPGDREREPEADREPDAVDAVLGRGPLVAGADAGGPPRRSWCRRGS